MSNVKDDFHSFQRRHLQLNQLLYVLFLFIILVALRMTNLDFGLLKPFFDFILMFFIFIFAWYLFFHWFYKQRHYKKVTGKKW